MSTSMPLCKTLTSIVARKAPRLLALLAVLTPVAAQAADVDPAGGKFTIEEAVKGISGSGKLNATIQTSLGDFSCELFDKEAPTTVANFVGLARGVRPYKDPVTGQWVKKSFYDGLIFHRVIPYFMIQGGDIQGNGTGEPGYTIKDETNAPHKFDKGGVLAMANRGPNTAGSQFFITEAAQPMLDDGGRTGGHYQIFGQCGPLELVQKISGQNRDSRDKPHVDIKITKVTFYRGEPKGDAGNGAGGKAPATKPAVKSGAATRPKAATTAAAGHAAGN